MEISDWASKLHQLHMSGQSCGDIRFWSITAVETAIDAVQFPERFRGEMELASAPYCCPICGIMTEAIATISLTSYLRFTVLNVRNEALTPCFRDLHPLRPNISMYGSSTNDLVDQVLRPRWPLASSQRYCGKQLL